jgi:hypothetical protein
MPSEDDSFAEIASELNKTEGEAEDEDEETERTDTDPAEATTESEREAEPKPEKTSETPSSSDNDSAESGNTSTGDSSTREDESSASWGGRQQINDRVKTTLRVPREQFGRLLILQKEFGMSVRNETLSMAMKRGLDDLGVTEDQEKIEQALEKWQK